MEFQLLLKELNTHNLPRKEFAISSSGVLAMRGIREANDIDLVVSNKLWKLLSKKLDITENPNRPLIQLSENISALGNAWEKGFDLYTNEELVRMAEDIDGILYVPLDIVIRMKKRNSREKDLRDLELIEQYKLQR